MHMIDNILPVFILLSIGFFLRKKNILKKDAVNGLKYLIVHLGLPAVLFKAFLNMTLKKEYIVVVLITIVLCAAAFLIGALVSRLSFFSSKLTPFFMTAFAFGLLGVSLFETMFGTEHLDSISILGIGNEFFLWFIYITLLRFKYTGERFSLETLKNFIRSPIILAVVLGLLLNSFNVAYVFKEWIIFRGIYSVINYLSMIATPLILITIGYGMVFNKKYFKTSLKFVLLRYVILFTVGYLLKITLLNLWIKDIYFDYAFFTFLILPPPFSLPVFISEYASDEDVELANNMVVVSIAGCFLLFVLFTIMIAIGN